MKLSTRSRYGTRALLDVAQRKNEEPVLLRDIAERQQFSLTYLEHLIAPLISGGLIKSTRGSKGGISLAKSPEEIKLIDIILLLEGSITPVECVENPGACARSEECKARIAWITLEKTIRETLGSMTLKDLMDHRTDGLHCEESMYYI